MATRSSRAPSDRSDHSPDGLTKLCQAIHQRVPVETLIVHPTAYALASGPDGNALVQGPFRSERPFARWIDQALPGNPPACSRRDLNCSPHRLRARLRTGWQRARPGPLHPQTEDHHRRWRPFQLRLLPGQIARVPDRPLPPHRRGHQRLLRAHRPKPSDTGLGKNAAELASLSMPLVVVKYGTPVLRQKGARIESVTPAIKKLAADMLETMYSYKGVGLAAQQVSVARQLTVIDVRGVTDRPSSLELNGQPSDVAGFMPLVLLNPEVKPVGEPATGPEG